MKPNGFFYPLLLVLSACATVSEDRPPTQADSVANIADNQAQEVPEESLTPELQQKDAGQPILTDITQPLAREEEEQKSAPPEPVKPPNPAQGQGSEEPEKGSEKAEQATQKERIDLIGVTEQEALAAREKLYDSAVVIANSLDKFFGEKEELESAGYDYLRLIGGIGWRDNEGVELDPDVKAKVHLPAIDKKVSLLLANGSLDDDDGLGSTLEQQVLENQDALDAVTAALNLESLLSDRNKLDWRLGVDSKLKTFVQLKHTFRAVETEKVLFRNFNYLFWRDGEGNGANIKFHLDTVIDDDDFFRWRYSILRSEKSEGNEWRTRTSWVHKFSERDWVSYDLDIDGKSAYDFLVETYRLAFRYRRRLNPEWLFIEIEPEFLWIREPGFSKRDFVPGIILRFEIQLDDKEEATLID